MLTLFISLKDSVAAKLRLPELANAFRQIENWSKDPSNGLLQPGDIISSVGSATKRPGFYLCNGATYPVTNQNAALQQALGQGGSTLTVPNLVNVFVLGSTSSGSNGGSAIATHTHPLSNNGFAKISWGAAGQIYLGRNTTASWTDTAKSTSSTAVPIVSDSTTTGLGIGLGGNTDTATISTLPPYVTLQYWIKY